MSEEQVRIYVKLLQVLQKANPTDRRRILETADPEFILLICNCFLNIIRGSLPLPPVAERKLAKYAKLMKEIATKGKKTAAVRRKRKLLMQHGGFLPALLTPVIALAGGLIGELIAKNI